jgi:hypothetical protein
MNDENYLSHCIELLEDFAQSFAQRTETLPDDDPLKQLAGSFTALAQSREDIYGRGSELSQLLFNNFPDMAPLLPRQLLWFFGGDCLHFMPDEEISQFQQLDEERERAAAEGNVYDLAEARAKLLNLQ